VGRRDQGGGWGAEAPAARVSTVTHDRSWSCSAFVMSAGQQRVWSARVAGRAANCARSKQLTRRTSLDSRWQSARLPGWANHGAWTFVTASTSATMVGSRAGRLSPRHDTRCPTQCERKSWALQTHLFTDFSPTLPEHWGRIDCRRLLGERP